MPVKYFKCKSKKLQKYKQYRKRIIESESNKTFYNSWNIGSHTYNKVTNIVFFLFASSEVYLLYLYND